MKFEKVFTFDISQKTQRQMYFFCTYEKPLVDVLRKVLKEGDVFLDVGAHVGYFTLLADSLVGTKGLVLSFEADKKNYDHLKKHVAFNKCYSCDAYNVAVSERIGNSVLHRNPLNEGGHSLGSFSVYKDSKKTLSEQEVREAFPSYFFSQEVSTTTLDASWTKLQGRVPKIVKIDVEGVELAVLNGATNLLKQEKSLILCEVTKERDKVLALMQQYGFDSYFLTPTGWQKTNEPQKGNFLFTKGWDRIPI